jgi:5-methylcytosine-specific restriction endonuclease McrA
MTELVLTEEPTLKSRAALVLLHRKLVRESLKQWFDFRDAFFNTFEVLTCHYCHKENLVREVQNNHDKQQLKYLATVDHVVPVSKGGEWYDPKNCVVACFPCNSHKADKLLNVL